ncbi:hypothetical protein [Nocardiopsis tropica]|uniref:Uncharacterized protein n=1 Tax=Nocardiopsis tropica TaxID=109330 RepID=A0ABU7KZF0_9ACTN|nr:hypothetical protein [Nocardiopsis umidischolae]MEE2054650.1 hypothetical protein [Nocardiopsis umidischolae]
MSETTPEALESQQAEAEAQGQEYVLVAMGEDTYRVIPQKQWRISFLRHLNEGDFEAWAECVMHPEDAETFIERDPTLDEFKDFSKAAARASGDGLGKSSGRRRS